jgi:hypothetical protein
MTETGDGHSGAEITAFTGRCPAAQDVGRIVGVDQLVQLGGTFGETSDGIICIYGRADDPPSVDASGLGTHRPGPGNFGVSVSQIRPDDSRVATFKRIASSLTSQSDPLDIELGTNVAVNARYMRTGRPGSAWLLAESVTAVTYLQIGPGATGNLSSDQARQQLHSLADLLDLGG